MLGTIIIFAIILGVLIFVHELGHFLVARRNGVTAHEFGFGFPPRIFGIVHDPSTGRRRMVWGNRDYRGTNTLYSLNWIPLGGFVRIKGEQPVSQEDLEDTTLSEEERAYARMSRDADSFAMQSIWTRTRILIAGVTMNALLAWGLVVIVLMIGAPEPRDAVSSRAIVVRDTGVQITNVEQASPADAMGVKIGDVVTSLCVGSAPCTAVPDADTLRTTIFAHKGESIHMQVLRGKEAVQLTGTLRAETVEDQGALGIAMADMSVVRYPWYAAVWEGLMRVISLIVLTVSTFWHLIVSLFGGPAVDAEVAGPVGIAILTQQMRDLGFVYLIQFAAVLSINLAIINILPIPALDGGRLFFLLIEAIKGRPVNQRFESMAHTIFFIALLLFMAIITVRDVVKLF